MNENRVSLSEQIVYASKQAGISRLVWNASSWIPDRLGDPFTYGLNTEAINKLWQSGVPGTVFGPVLLMDNLLTDWARLFLMPDKRYIYPHAPDLKSHWISPEVLKAPPVPNRDWHHD